MREVRHTFEHLVIILVVLCVCVGLILAIPAVRLWLFENAPAAMGKMAGTGTMSTVLVGVDPQLLANAINDDDTRDEIIALWQRSVPEMDPEALADMANEIVTDPNTATLIADVMAALDAEKASQFYNTLLGDTALADHLVALFPKLDAKGMAGVVNTIMESKATARLVNDIINNIDNSATANFVNALLQDEDTSEAVVNLLGHIDGKQVGLMINAVAREAGGDKSKLVGFINDLVSTSAPENMAALVNKILNQVDDKGNNVVVDKVAELLVALDEKTFDSFLVQLMESPGMDSFLQGTLGNMNPANPNGGYEVVKNLLTPYSVDADGKRNWNVGQYFHKALLGQRAVDDALMDYMWVECEVTNVFTNGMPVDEFMAQQIKQMIPAVVEWQLNNLGLGAAAEAINSVLGPLIIDTIADGIGGMVGVFFSTAFTDVAWYVTVLDSGFGVTPFYDMEGWYSQIHTDSPWDVYQPESVNPPKF